jgi:hypothetical protein
MVRVRSPNYPALSLPEAIKSATAIQAAEQHLAAPKEVVAKHLGYASLHGHAGRAISAIENYGLLEEVNGDKVKVSPLAMSILFPASPEEKQNAIKEAAFKHPLFMAIKEEWQGSRPSDENLRVYLIRRKFAADALDRVIEVYKATMDLVTLDPGVYPARESGQPRQGREQTVMQTPSQQVQLRTQSSARTTGYTSPPVDEPFRVTFTGQGIDVAGRLATTESADDFVGAINALKPLLRRVDEVKKPKVDDEDEAAI